jgi:hypothetical protein
LRRLALHLLIAALLGTSIMLIPPILLREKAAEQQAPSSLPKKSEQAEERSSFTYTVVEGGIAYYSLELALMVLLGAVLAAIVSAAAKYLILRSHALERSASAGHPFQ